MSIDSPNAQPHLDKIRADLLAAMLERTAFEGWTSGVLAVAAKDADIDPGAVDLACPRGELDILAYWSAKLDEAMLAAMEAADMPAMRIRERVTFAVQARLEAIGEHNREAAARAAARLGRPDALLMGKQLIWQSADAIWRGLGDTSTDYNYYTKRTILSAVLGSTMMVWFEGDEARTKRFLDRRIENVMQFERLKGKVRKAAATWPDPVTTLARLRYGRGKARPRRM